MYVFVHGKLNIIKVIQVYKYINYYYYLNWLFSNLQVIGSTIALVFFLGISLTFVVVLEKNNLRIIISIGGSEPLYNL